MRIPITPNQHNLLVKRKTAMDEAVREAQIFSEPEMLRLAAKACEARANAAAQALGDVISAVVADFAPALDGKELSGFTFGKDEAGCYLTVQEPATEEQDVSVG